MASFTKSSFAVFMLLAATSITAKKQPSQNCTEEPYRPRYHFSPALNTMGNPSGLVYYNGIYHLFFLYQPYNWGPMHWGHAISEDLATWQELDMALEPDNLGMILGGSCVVDYQNTTGFQTDPNVHPIVAIFTHSGDKQRQSIAYSLDVGSTFTKYEGNPVIDNPGLADFRDPKVILYEDTWVMVLAAGDHAQFYSSPDLKSWTKTSEFGRDPEEGHRGGIWENPDLVPLSSVKLDGTVVNMWVLIISTTNHPNGGSGTHYIVGSFNGTHFNTTGWDSYQWLDWGWDNYGGQTFFNEPSGRAVYLALMSNKVYQGQAPTGAWQGHMTLPRQLELRLGSGDGSQSEHYKLTMRPVEELANLRVDFWESDYEVDPGSGYVIDPLVDDASALEVEMSLEVDTPTETNIELAFLRYSVRITLNYTNDRWHLDRSDRWDPAFNAELQPLMVAEAARGRNATTINIRMFLDVSTIEFFLDDGLVSMTTQFFAPENFLDTFLIQHLRYDGDFDKPPINVTSFKAWGLKCWHA